MNGNPDWDESKRIITEILQNHSIHLKLDSGAQKDLSWWKDKLEEIISDSEKESKVAYENKDERIMAIIEKMKKYAGCSRLARMSPKELKQVETSSCFIERQDMKKTFERLLLEMERDPLFFLHI